MIQVKKDKKPYQSAFTERSTGKHNPRQQFPKTKPLHGSKYSLSSFACGPANTQIQREKGEQRWYVSGTLDSINKKDLFHKTHQTYTQQLQCQ